MVIDIRRRMSGENRRGDLRNLVRSRGAFRKRTGPQTVAASNVSVERYIKFVEQLEPETGLENLEWIPHDGWGTKTGVLHAFWNPLATPTSIDSNGNKIYDYRMRGVRFAIDGHNDLWNWTAALQSHFTSPNLPVTGRTSILPSSDSHLSLNLTQIQISNSGISSFRFVTVATTHYRIWIDGVDVTGIVALGTPFTHSVTISPDPYARNVGGLLPVSIAAGSYQSKSVWFDLWVSARVVNRPSDAFGDPSSWTGYFPVAQVSNYAEHHRSRFNYANVNAKRYVGDLYKITFSDNGPGGLSELNVASGGGWALVDSVAGFKMTKVGTGSVELNWSTESPVLTCSIDAKINSPAGASGNMRYLPAGSEYQHRNQNNSVIQYGTWNPQGTTVFQQVARAFGSTYYTKGSASAPASFFTGFPTTITVEKIS